MIASGIVTSYVASPFRASANDGSWIAGLWAMPSMRAGRYSIADVKWLSSNNPENLDIEVAMLYYCEKGCVA
jgi:hypothetical protein